MAVGLGCDGIRDEDLATALEVATSGGAAVLGLPSYGLEPGCAADLSLVPATTHGGAAVLGLDGHGLEPGCRADLTLVAAETVAEAVVTHPPRSLVLKAGRVVAGP